MVGVGGRSKGCKTCRRRRVKCDEGKPKCARCHKAGKICEGYTQFVEFHDETTRIAGKDFQIQTSNSPGFTGSPQSITSQPGVQTTFITEYPFFPVKADPGWDEHSIFTTYLVDRLFTWQKPQAQYSSFSWMPVLVGRTENEGLLAYTSLRALATSFFAKVHGEPSIMHKGTAFYSRALRVLQDQLQDSELVFDDDVLLSVFCLSVYELIMFTDLSAWINHHKGLARLTALRGPYRHQTGVGHALLPRLRSTISIAWIIQRKHCFLENPEWKTIPWAISGLESRMPLEKLHDYLVDCPGILEDLDRLRAWGPNVPGKAEFQANFAMRAHLLLEGLYSWRWRWQEDFPDATYLISTATLDPAVALYLPSSCPFKTLIWFHDDHRATELIIYNAAQLIITAALDEAGVEIKIPATPYLSDPLLPMQGRRYDIAVEICRMASFHLQKARNSMGAFMILFPLNSALRHLDDRGGVKKWLLKLLQAMADMHGFEVGTRRYVYVLHAPEGRVTETQSPPSVTSE
ncbi:hypothetical protein N7478_007219 [Penicillium angulare]|uniref:uncharacterized protein n=1 Tax=Penicillium angulare TaxID=116970 RepID=UPI002541FE9A|nr:uncharacterized protein N7478_007219 [Penicillium angulare]KAJ5281847.1 hypothetical protein N7478_007219 [Penicillium angulare]